MPSHVMRSFWRHQSVEKSRNRSLMVGLLSLLLMLQPCAPSEMKFAWTFHCFRLLYARTGQRGNLLPMTITRPVRQSKVQLHGRRGRGGSLAKKVVDQTKYVQISRDGNNVWRTSPEIASILSQGGCGVLPTDTGYGFVTSLDSKAGLERILRIKGFEGCKKPLSLLCADLATIDKYCYGIDRRVFKILKSNLPGPYTFILPASTALPKMMFIDSRGGKRNWDRKTLGVRIPNDPILRFIQDELEGMPLLVSSLPTTNDGQQLVCEVDPGASWCNSVDFIVDAGERPVDGSTVYDLTGGEVELVREGLGDYLAVA